MLSRDLILRGAERTEATTRCGCRAAKTKCPHAVQEAEVVALPRIILKRWPGSGVDVLVNNAGLGRNNAALWDGSTASWVEMISTNVLGVCMCTREALKVLNSSYLSCCSRMRAGTCHLCWNHCLIDSNAYSNPHREGSPS